MLDKIKKIEPDTMVFLGCMLAWFAWSMLQLV
jgi:hypothetical protein